jgi:hypothetical protein
MVWTHLARATSADGRIGKEKVKSFSSSRQKNDAISET